MTQCLQLYIEQASPFGVCLQSVHLGLTLSATVMTLEELLLRLHSCTGCFSVDLITARRA